MRKVYNKPQSKTNIKKAGAEVDIMNTISPYISGGIQGLAGGGVLALGAIRRKLKKMRGPEPGAPFTGGKK